jgi:putative OPT family oligopeptide transporter
MVGSTSNPSSGMTITILLVTCLLFLSLGWTERVHLIAAVAVGCVANIAIAMAATTSQDLKTGFLIGATPRAQQIAEMFGLLIPALTLGITIALLNKTYVIGSSNMPAPQAVLISMIVKGVISKSLPYGLVLIGVVLGLILKFLRLPVLAIALGLYLPLSLSMGTMVGGLLSWYFKDYLKEKSELGILIASGLVGGDACSGIFVAILTITGFVAANAKPFFSPYVSVILYGLLSLGFIFLAKIHTQKASEKIK